MEKLVKMVNDIEHRNIKLLLLTGPRGSGKSKCLSRLATHLGVSAISIGSRVAHRLAAIQRDERAFHVREILHDLASESTSNGLLLLDNIEVLFERALCVDPLDQLLRLAHARRVVAVWPGELRGDRLVYADIHHPEHRDYSADGVVVFEV